MAERASSSTLDAPPKFPDFCRTTFDQDAPELFSKLPRCRGDFSATFICALKSDTKVSWVNLERLGEQGTKMRA